MNLPNTITVVRLFLVPVFVYFAYQGTRTGQIAAFVTFLVASLSDSLDGYLARKHGIVTKLGEFLDPLADKILVLAALVVLVEHRAFPVIAALIVLARELAVQLLRNRIVSRGGTLPASAIAKAKTVLQIILVSWWLLPLEVGIVHWTLLAAALVATLWSGAQYFVVYNQAKGATP